MTFTQSIRFSARNKEYKRAVRDKYNRQCAVCGKRTYIVHHLITLSQLVKEFLELFKEFDIRKDFKILKFLIHHHAPVWDVENGVVLCGKHHRKAHGIIKKRKKKNVEIHVNN